MINANGERFVDEGADFRNYTYAKYGGAILNQPGQFAWQIFDAKVSHLQRDEYRIRQVTRVSAGSLEELVAKLDGVNPEAALTNIADYNAAVRTDVPFDPNTKDGRGTRGLAVPKTNWANTIDEPPFEAFAVTCGVTFTFGGLRIDTTGGVLDTDLKPIGGALCGGRTGWRAVLFQLSRRHRTDVGCGLRPPGRIIRGLGLPGRRRDAMSRWAEAIASAGDLPHYMVVDGERVAAGGREETETRDPGSGLSLCHVPAATVQDVDGAVNAADRALCRALG